MAGESSVRPPLFLLSGAGALKAGWYWLVILALLGGCVATGISLVQRPVYAASATMYVTIAGGDSNVQSVYQGNLASQQRVASYARLATSTVVLEDAVRQTSLSGGVDAARRLVSTDWSPETVLLTVTARSGAPDAAAQLANAVASATSARVAALETPLGSDSSLAKLSVVSPAEPPSFAVSPNTKMNLVFGLVAGLIAGGLFVVFRARYSSRVDSADRLAAVGGGVPVLASIPDDDTVRQRTLVDFSSGSGGAAEAFRRLRSNIRFANVDSPPTIIAVTSCLPGEGKTSTSLNLAASYAEMGKRVIVVEADLRRPSISSILGIGTEAGLTSALRRDGDVLDFVQKSTYGFWVLPCGEIPPNPAELLDTEQTGSVLSALANSFDLIVIDTPPVKPVIDAVVLSQHVDGFVFVALSGRSRSQDIELGLSALREGHANVLGSVLNGDRRMFRAYGDRYYGYLASDGAPSRVVSVL